MPTTKHTTKSTCPRCEVTLIAHVHCANLGCPFHIHVCDRCDRAQAVDAFMLDHAKDCRHAAPVIHLQANAPVPGERRAA